MELMSLDRSAKKGQWRGQKRQKGRGVQSWGRCAPTPPLLGAQDARPAALRPT